MSTSKKPAFTALSRCDRCRAQAYVRATREAQELFFCLHHSRKHVLTLISSGWELDDRSHVIKNVNRTKEQ